MKTYIGTKQVKAEPMDELAAVEKGYARKIAMVCFPLTNRSINKAV